MDEDMLFGYEKLIVYADQAHNQSMIDRLLATRWNASLQLNGNWHFFFCASDQVEQDTKSEMHLNVTRDIVGQKYIHTRQNLTLKQLIQVLIQDCWNSEFKIWLLENSENISLLRSESFSVY